MILAALQVKQFSTRHFPGSTFRIMAAISFAIAVQRSLHHQKLMNYACASQLARAASIIRIV